MRGTEKTGTRMAAKALIVALMYLWLAGCAASSSSQALDWKQVDPSAFGSQTFNTTGIMTYGPTGQQLYGYFLCADGVTVSMSGRITGTPIGRMSLADVQQDYQRVLRDNMMQGGNLILREVVRNGSVVAYTATMPMLNVTTWDMAPGTPNSNAVLQVTFP